MEPKLFNPDLEQDSAWKQENEHLKTNKKNFEKNWNIFYSNIFNFLITSTAFTLPN